MCKAQLKLFTDRSSCVQNVGHAHERSSTARRLVPLINRRINNALLERREQKKTHSRDDD